MVGECGSVRSKKQDHNNSMTHYLPLLPLYNHQHEFRSKLSTETQLTEFTEDMLRGMKDEKKSDVVVMDFTKAFD